MNIFEEIISKDDLCFDVGANIGKKADTFLSLGAKVVCVEPQEKCVKILFDKFKNNDKVIIVAKGLSSSDGEKRIFISPADTITSMSEEFIRTVKEDRFRAETWDTNSETFCHTTTMDNLINLYGLPNFCKIDVEGYELEVLKGLSKPIPNISIEFTPELKHLTFKCIEHMLEIANYKFNYSEGESLKFSFQRWVSKEDIINFLKQKNDHRSFGDLYMKCFDKTNNI